MKNNENNDEWSFVHVTDMHIGSPRSYRFQPAWNQNWQTAREQIGQLSPDLLLVGGDMTRDGTTHIEELIESKRELEALDTPLLVIPGNHEVGNKWSADSSVAIRSAYLDRYRDIYGVSEWTTAWGRGENAVQFTGINAFLLGSGLPEETALREWLGALERNPSCAHHVWLIHPAMFADEFDEPDFDPITDRVPWYFGLNRIDRAFLWGVMQKTGASQVLSGHIHCRRQVCHDGVDFFYGPATAFPQWGERWPDGDSSLGFMEFKVAGGKISSRFVPLREVSELPGYGPGGNPAVAGRDYTVAEETPSFIPCLDHD